MINRRMIRFLLLLLAGIVLLGPFASGEKSILLTFTGDCTIGCDEKYRREEDSFASVIAREGIAYPFERFRFLFDRDDCTVINLEGVLTDSVSEEDKSKTYRFRGDTSFAAILTEASVEACSLANNHIKDFGGQGLRNTQQTLTDNNIGWFWLMEPYIFEKDGIRIAFFSVDESSYRTVSEKLRKKMLQMKADGEVNAIVVCVHSGREYTAAHYPMQEKHGKVLTDYGADLVITNHPHVVQGLLIANNRTVCYSLGNFVFGGNSRIKSVSYRNRLLTSQYSLVVQARLDFSDDGVYLGQQVTLYPAFTSDDPVDNHYQPYPVLGKDAAAVMDAAQYDTQFTLPDIQATDDYSFVEMPYLSAEPDT